MSSKAKGGAPSRPASSKRTAFPRRWDCTSVFEKSWRRHEKAGRLDLNDLKAVMGLLIANDGPLSARYKDHALHKDKRWQDCRECHVHGDFLLVYRLKDDGGTVIFMDVGTHADLFE